MCNGVFSSILLYNKHQILHKDMPYLKIICLFKNCGQQFNKYLNFKKHIFRQHSTNKKQTCITYCCKERNCNAHFNNRLNFKKHLYKHIKLGFIADIQLVLLIKCSKQSALIQYTYVDIIQIIILISNLLLIINN